ncbi:MAG: CPBP family intramembrane metalloprotease [Asgard group archaeon]|nr:CPBP family intramembrane metalloprotease [Asgard group archaeon]
MPEEQDKQSDVKESSTDETPLEDQEENNQYCPKCHKKNEKNNLFCNYCGQHFVEEVECPRCSSMMPVFNSFCGRCGASMKSAQKIITTEEELKMGSSSPLLTTYDDNINSQRHMEYTRQQKQQTRQMTANVFGIIFIVFGIVSILFLILQLAMFSSDYLVELLEQYEMDLGVDSLTLYTSLIAFELPPIIILIISGISLLKPKMKTKPWKSLYHILRYVFVSFSAVISLFCIIATVGWIFYNPAIPYPEDLYVWAFKIKFIEISLTTSNLYLLLFSFYFISIILLVLPPIVSLIKEKVKKDESKLEDEVIESTDEEITLELDEKKQLIFTSSRAQLEAVKKRKGPMPAIFYKIKNTPLIKSMELLGFSLIVSFVIVLIFSRFATGDADPITGDDVFTYMIQLAWAGVFEEIGFRLLLIGAPMIIVVGVRYLLQYLSKNKIANISDKYSRIDTELGVKDLLLSFRGKYKIIGIPEIVILSTSALTFGFAHWSGWIGGWGWWKIIQASAAGFFLSYAFVKYGLEAAIFIHVTNNVISAMTLFSAEVPGASWLGVFSGLSTFIFMFIGAMKGTSVIINLVYRHRIIKIPETAI